ncbi:flagellar assembly peptidoglycan hydrolase FlgJ [Pseudorhodoferax soli]|uniref:Flagellar rod assembly protein/muramidase FlgJ n=1 Tax=Pseudorhodoferax soli TaxID=545864 RepID=A0A368XTW0_9BURK|nr:flagellar assembly peptidoglycan hydrolase FlgJ [Pseudorhodoferax soli]RCW70478.1 flagellar rod assembly protein/muramidase FlgJ [Pseudorhodoferax soli]
MQTPESTSLRALRPLAPTQPLAASGGGVQAASFANAMRSAETEIGDLVRNGWSHSELPVMGTEGLLRRMAALQATAVADTQGSALPLLTPGLARTPRASSGTSGTASTAALAPGQAVPAAAQRDFLQAITPWAREAGAALGVAPELVAAHAALESGWGRRPLRGADGGDSHNLFGIKANSSWRGASVQALTTEYEDGAAQKTTEAFRAYPDHASAFRDYAQLLQSSPRYQEALNTGSDAAAFAQGLARGGYATDPDYAAKLARVVRQVQARGAAE